MPALQGRGLRPCRLQRMRPRCSDSTARHPRLPYRLVPHARLGADILSVVRPFLDEGIGPATDRGRPSIQFRLKSKNTQAAEDACFASSAACIALAVRSKPPANLGFESLVEVVLCAHRELAAEADVEIAAEEE